MQLALILAQVTNSVPADTGVNVGAFGSPQTWIDLFTPFVAPILTAVVKKVMSKLPSVAIPPIAIALGVLVNAVGSVTLGSDVNIIKAVLLGMSGIGLRELVTQIKNINAPPTL